MSQTRTPGRDLRLARDQVRQLFDGLRARFVAAQPEPVVDVIAPDVAIKMVQLVVMRRDRGAVDGAARSDQSVVQVSNLHSQNEQVENLPYITTNARHR